MAIKNLGKVVGDSAYEVWLKQGNTGTEEDFIKSLSPVKGEDYFTPEEVDAIKRECKQQVVVGDVTEASIMMADNVNVQLSEPLTQLFLEYPEEIEIGYRSEITFTMDETEMTFYPDLEYDGDIAWYGEYVSEGRPYMSLGSTYHIVFTYDVNGMKAIINPETYLNKMEETKNKVTEITDEHKEEDYPNVDAVKKYLQESIVNAEIPIVDFSGQSLNYQEPRTLADDYTKTSFQPILDKMLAAIEAGKVYSFGVKTSQIDICIFSYSSNGSYGASNLIVNCIGNQVLKSNGGLYQARVPGISMVYNRSNELMSVSFGSSVKLLTSDNEYNYTVSNDYTPAHKKYVDSTIAAKIAEIDIPEAKTLEEQGIFLFDAYGKGYFQVGTYTINVTEYEGLSEFLQDETKIHKVIILRTEGSGVVLINRSGNASNGTFYGLTKSYKSASDEFLLWYGFTKITDNEYKLSITKYDYLTQNNTTSYSVTTNYQPAHKKYVDDAIAAIPTAEQEVYVLTPTDTNYLSFFRGYQDETYSMYYDAGSMHTDFAAQLKETLQKVFDKNIDRYGIALDIDDNVVVFRGNTSLLTKPTTLKLSANFMDQYSSDAKKLWFKQVIFTLTLTWNENIISEVKVSMAANGGRILSTNNTAEFTPTSNYHPATKKYVDDSIGDISTILSTLTTVSEVSE